MTNTTNKATICVATHEALVQQLAASGFTPPAVTTLDDLYAGYVQWCREKDIAPAPAQHFALNLARSHMPCQLSDGRLAFLRLKLRGDALQWGTLQ
ncbi:hypothetical protein [Eleftheria terrae]|uniref:hypothetical protein n=1 Tax=Eleftheria terrae TaxID=1597781 RepID=UPI00263AA156|nr:hypothetical protein [Eleftheria terrae]WKB55995.1 hypothetical protein N7L95_28405 [Eleftheria terrae]